MKTENIVLIGVGVAVAGYAAYKFGLLDRLRGSAPAQQLPTTTNQQLPSNKVLPEKTTTTEVTQSVKDLIASLTNSFTIAPVTDKTLRDQGIFAYKDIVTADGTTFRQTQVAGLGNAAALVL